MISMNAAFAGPSGAEIAWRSIGPGEFGAMFGMAISPHDPKVIVAGLDMGNAFMTRDGGKSWKIIGRNGGKAAANPAYRGVWGVCFDPKRPGRIFIGSTHGLFRSTDGGDNWRLVYGGGSESTTHAIAIDPANPDVIYAANGVSGRNGVEWSRGQVQRSTDGGDTWTTLGRDGPLAKAAVGGANWVTLAIDPGSPLAAHRGHRRVYLCGQSGFFVSEDGGDTWTNLEDKLPGGDAGRGARRICDLALIPEHDHTALLASMPVRYADAEQKHLLGGIYRSDDGGQTWRERNKGLEESLSGCAHGEFRYCLLAGCAARPNVVYMNNAAGVYKTEDGGGSWQSVVKIGTVWRKTKEANGQTVEWRLRDRTGNFDQSYYDVYGPANGLAVCPSDPNAVVYGDNAGMGLSYDGGAHWTEPGFEFGEAIWPGEFGDLPPMQPTHKVRSRGIQLIEPLAAAIDPFDPKTIAIGYADTGLEISRDNGAWWEWAYHGMVEGERNYSRAILFDPGVRNRLYTGGGGWGSHGHVYRSDDGGRTFSPIGIPQLDQAADRTRTKPYVHALALDPSTPASGRVLYAGTDLGLFRTPDGDKTWRRLDVVPGKDSYSVRNVIVDPSDPHRLYVSAADEADPRVDGLYRSDNGGDTWSRLGLAEIGGIKSISLCGATGTLYVIAAQPGKPMSYWTPRALWRSDDHGGHWRQLDARLGAAVAASPRDPQRLYYLAFAQNVKTDETNVYQSSDGGKTWNAAANDIPLSPGGYGNVIVFDPANPARLLLTHDSGAYEGVIRR